MLPSSYQSKAQLDRRGGSDFWVQLNSDSRESLLKDLTVVFGLRSVHTPDDDLEELFIELTKTTPEAS